MEIMEIKNEKSCTVDLETYRKAGQEFKGEYITTEDIPFREVTTPNEITELLGDDWESNEQYCSLCSNVNLQTFELWVAEKVVSKKDKRLILILCEDCIEDRR